MKIGISFRINCVSSAKFHSNSKQYSCHVSTCQCDFFLSCSIFRVLLTTNTNPFSELLELRQTSLGDVRWLWNRAVLRLLLSTPGLGGRRPSRDLQQSSASRTSKISVSKPSQNRKRSSVERKRGKYRRAYTGQWYNQGEVTLRRELLSTQTIR